MKLSAYTSLIFMLPVIGSHCIAAEGSEPDVPIVVPPERSLDAYNSAIAQLESAVDVYFHDALRRRESVTDEKLKQLDAALEEQARLAAEPDTPSLLTVREMVVRAKLIVLSELDERFAAGSAPEDIQQKLEFLYVERSTAIDLLIEGGEL